MENTSLIIFSCSLIRDDLRGFPSSVWKLFLPDAKAKVTADTEAAGTWQPGPGWAIAPAQLNTFQGSFFGWPVEQEKHHHVLPVMFSKRILMLHSHH